MRVRNHANPLNFNQRLEKVNLIDLFKTENNSYHLEIGFGRGIFIQKMAKSCPEINIVGIDVRKQICELLNEKITQKDIKNVHALHGNAQICLEDMFDDDTFDVIYIFHPDPWLKKRHYKRRVVNDNLLSILKKRLKANGNVFISTDVAELWDDINLQFESFPEFTPINNHEFWDTHYNTHWEAFSSRTNRDQFMGTWKLTK